MAKQEKKVHSAILVNGDDTMVGRTLTTAEEVEAYGFEKEDLARLEREGAISGFGDEVLPEESAGTGAFGPESGEAGAKGSETESGTAKAASKSKK